MRTFQGLGIALMLVSGPAARIGIAQVRGSVTPTVTGSFGSVVFPGGSPATSPNVSRSFGSVVNPGGGGPRVNVPGGVVPNFARPNRTGRRNAPVTAYPYPVYVGGGYGGGYYGGGYSDGYAADGGGGPPQQGQQQPNVTQPNVTVVMAPPQPVIINVGPGGGQYAGAPERQPGMQEPSSSPAAEESAAADEPQHYLIAFKDHTIYSAIAYWVDGDTLHYFTAGNTHNQVSVSLVDRALTQRLNKESGVEFKIPAR
jgi:hypothetical protein